MQILDSFNTLIGIGSEPKNLTFLQISLRGIIVFVATLIIIRLGHKRSLTRKTAFDAVLVVILASVLSRAINGTGAFYPTIGGSFVLVMLHRLIAFAAWRWHGLGILIKGEPDVLLRDGQLDRKGMKQNHVSEHDFEEDMRLSAKTEDKSTVKIARIERSGDISFIQNSN
jgi:uncharacterized membrane protein YcaP (DUF421 family)